MAELINQTQTIENHSSVVKKCEPKNIRHTVIDSKEDFDNLESKWNRLSEQTNGSIFQTFDWNRTWWEYFGDYGKLQIFVLYDGDEIVGIAPLFLDKYSLFGISSFTWLRLIGSNVRKTQEGTLMGTNAYSDYLQFEMLDEYKVSFYEHLMDFIKNETRFDALILEEIPENSSTLDILENDFASIGFNVDIKIESKTSLIVPRGKGWEGYLKNLSTKERRNVRKSLRSIDGSSNDEVRVVKLDNNHDDFELYLEHFMELHTDQWNREGFPGTFLQKSMKNFFLETCGKLIEKKFIRIYTLTPIGSTGIENSVAMAIVINYNNRLYLQHGGMDMTSPLLNIGPGMLLNATIIKEAVEGELIFDFLRGDEKYKERLANKINQNRTIEISSASGRKDLIRKMISINQKLKKRFINEIVRKNLISKNHSYFSGWYHYIQFLFDRLANKINKV